MATVRELRAVFTAEAKGLQRAFQSIRTEISRIGPDTQRATGQVNQSYGKLITSTGKLEQAIKDSGDPDAFDDLNKAIRDAQEEMRDTGKVSDASMRELNRAVQGSSQHLDALGDEARSSFGDIETAISDVNRDLQTLGVQNGLNNLDSDVQNSQNHLNNLNNSSDTANNNLGNLGGSNQLGDLQSDTTQSINNLNNLNDATNNADQDIGNLGGDSDLDNLNDDLDETENNLDDLHDQLDDVGDSTNDASDEMENFGDTAQRESSSAEGSFGKLGGALKTFAGFLAAAFAIDQIKDFGTELAATAGAAEASKAQFSTVFGDMEGEAAERLRAIGGEATILENRMKDSFTKIAAFAKTGGMDTADSLELADRSMRAIADSAAFYDRSLEDTTESLQSFLKGNYENDAALGLSATETTRNSAAMDLYGEKFKNLSEAQKQLTLLQMVEDANELTGAMGQASRESEGWENVVGNMSQAWTDFKAEIGEPVLTLAVKGLTTATKLLQGIDTDKIRAGLGGALSFVSGAADKAKAGIDLFRKGFGALREFLKGEETAESILQSFGFNPDDFQKAIQIMNSAKEALSKIWSSFKTGKVYVEAVLALFNNKSGTAIQLLHKLGLNPEQIQSIMDGVGRVKETFTRFLEGLQTYAQSKSNGIISAFKLITKGVIDTFNYLMPIIRPALEAVFSFASGIIKKIADFWVSDGATIIAALQNVGKIAGVVFAGILKVIQFVMPLVLGIIKMVWGNIKGVITGALDIIMGAIKIFSGLFTGDFAKMWEGIKQLFMGAVQFVWNLVQLTFYGKILSGAKGFILSFRTFFTSMWTAVKQLFSGSITSAAITLRTGWATMARNVKDFGTGIINFFKNTWASIKSITSGFINGVKLVFTNGWTFIRNATTNSFRNIFNFLRDIWSSIRNNVSNSVTGILNKVRDTWSALKNNTSNAFRDIYNGIKSRFTNIVDLAKGLPRRIGDGIGAMASKVTSGVTKVINTLARTLGKGVNGVIGGINWVLGKIGVDKDIPKWEVPQYAQGTKGNGKHPGGLMVVGDGTGSNSGPELIETPDGKQTLSPSKPTLTTAPKGTKVWSATETKSIMDMIPHYGWGDDIKSGLRTAGNWAKDTYNSGKEKVKAVGSKIKEVAVDAFDYIKSPGKFLDLALKTLGIEKPKSGNFVGDMAVGAWNKTKSAAIDFVKSKLSDFGATQSGIALTGGNGGGFGAPFRLTSRPGPRNTGIPGASRMHKGWDWAAPVGTPIPSVTDGIGYRTGFHRLSGNFVEVKDNAGKIHRYQHNSKNIMRVGQKVKKGQTIALVGATGVGSGPHLHYEPRGYEEGGIVDGSMGAQLAWLTEGGWAESVISHDPSKKTSQKAIWEQTGKELGFDTNNSETLAYLRRIAEAVESGHGHDIIMSERAVAKAVAPFVTANQNLKGRLKEGKI